MPKWAIIFLFALVSRLAIWGSQNKFVKSFLRPEITFSAEEKLTSDIIHSYIYQDLFQAFPKHILSSSFY